MVLGGKKEKSHLTKGEFFFFLFVTRFWQPRFFLKAAPFNHIKGKHTLMRDQLHILFLVKLFPKYILMAVNIHNNHAKL